MANNATSLSMARNVLKSAAAITSSRLPPPSPISNETLQTAREALRSASGDTVPLGIELVPGLQVVGNFFKGSLTAVSFGLEKLHSLLRSAGEMGKKLLGVIQEHPAKAVAVTGGVLLVVAFGVSKYKYYLVTVPDDQGILSQPAESISKAPLAIDGSADFAGVELQELNLMRCPITEAPFQDPVVASDGYTYERYAIEHWFQSGQRFENFSLWSLYVSPFFVGLFLFFPLESPQ